jgi:hypothetical protein
MSDNKLGIFDMTDWDRSHDWVLIKDTHYCIKIFIRFQKNIPSASELQAVRRCIPEWRNISVMGLLKLIIQDGYLVSHDVLSSDAIKIILDAKKAGLNANLHYTCINSYLPIDRTTSTALLISDEFQSHRVTQAMIAAGVPIENDEDFWKNNN